MASITIRNLSDQSKEKLRVQAAQKGISLEAHVRRLLQEASGVEATQPVNLLELARRFFGARGGVDLELPQRGSHRKVGYFES